MRFLKFDYVFAPLSLSLSLSISVSLYVSLAPVSLFLYLSFAKVRGGRVRNSVFYVFYYWFNSFLFE